jgi:hypothetical protein
VRTGEPGCPECEGRGYVLYRLGRPGGDGTLFGGGIVVGVVIG